MIGSYCSICVLSMAVGLSTYADAFGCCWIGKDSTEYYKDPNERRFQSIQLLHVAHFFRLAGPMQQALASSELEVSEAHRIPESRGGG